MKQTKSISNLLFFLNGILIASLIYFHSENSYEEQLFEILAANISNNLPADVTIREDSLLLKSMHLCHKLLKRRGTIFGNADFEGFKAKILQPVTVDLMTGKGACGSNSYVLGRLLQEFGMNVRFLHMKVGNLYGGHILIEAKSSGGWKVLDPLYDLYFKRPDGKLASFKDVQSNWSYYKQQVPPEYDTAYNYSDAIYNNWGKIPVLMPLLKHVLYFVVGKEATDNYSLRTFVLRKYSIAFWITFIIYLLVIFYMIYTFAGTRCPLQTGTK